MHTGYAQLLDRGLISHARQQQPTKILSLQSPDEDAAMKAVDEAFKSGVNFFDVAPFYASGDAERVRIARRLCQYSYKC